MAAPNVALAAAPSKQSGTVTSHPITLPASMANGDGCIAVLVVDNGYAITWPAGWTEIVTAVADSTNLDDVRISAARRVIDGTEGGTVTPTTGTGTRSIGHAFRVTGGDVTAVQSASAVADTGVTTIDPAAVSGLTLGDYLAIALAGSDQWKNGTWTFPTSYANTGDDTSADANLNVTLAWGTRQLTGVTSEDPSAFSHDASSDQMVALTLMIPAAASGPSVTATDGTVQIGEAGLAHAPVAAGTEVFTANPAFAGTINGATLDPDGAAIDITSLLSSLSSSSATLTAEDVSAFRVGGAWNAIRWGVDYVIRFTDGTDTADVNCKFTAPVPTRFGAIVTPNATYHPGAAIATDESYGLFTVGEGTHDPADGDTTANIFVAGVATFQPFAYDLSAGNWIEGTAVPFADGAIPECPQQLSNSVLGPLHSPVENFTCLRTY